MSTPTIVAIIVLVAVAWALVWLPKRTRSRHYAVTTVIDRDPASVFGFIADFPRLVSFVDRAQSTTKLTEAPLGVGSRFRIDVVVGSVRFVSEAEVLVFDAPRQIAWREAGYVPCIETVTLEAHLRGTSVTHRLDAVVGYVNGLLGEGLIAPLMNAVGARERRESWARIKRELESGRTA